jgi:hypothetical protein
MLKASPAPLLQSEESIPEQLSQSEESLSEQLLQIEESIPKQLSQSDKSTSFIEQIDSIFTVTFYMTAIVLLKRLTRYLEIHSAFREVIDPMKSLKIAELDREFEQKMAMYISLNIENAKQSIKSVRFYMITEIDVIVEINILIKTVLHNAYHSFPSENNIQNLRDGYPINILMAICNTKMTYARVIGESVRKFIELRRTYPTLLPPELSNIIEGNLSLTGQPNSPLTLSELEVLYKYLGVRKNIYVHILLNCLYEFSQHDKFMKKIHLTEEEIIILCTSSWLFLFLSSYVQKLVRRTSPSSNVNLY